MSAIEAASLFNKVLFCSVLLQLKWDC